MNIQSNCIELVFGTSLNDLNQGPVNLERELLDGIKVDSLLNKLFAAELEQQSMLSLPKLWIAKLEEGGAL